ncbi:cytochrome P450 [Aspergillus insuetus]
MKKLDSFVHESLRLSTFPVSLTGWRMVTGNAFDFSDGLVLPRGSSFTFPTLNMRLDSDVYQQPEMFDGLRFYRRQKNQNQESEGDGATPSTNASSIANATSYRSLVFGYGRQAFPGRVYSIRLLKLILSTMIMRYEIRYSDSDELVPVMVMLPVGGNPLYLIWSHCLRLRRGRRRWRLE